MARILVTEEIAEGGLDRLREEGQGQQVCRILPTDAARPQIKQRFLVDRTGG